MFNYQEAQRWPRLLAILKIAKVPFWFIWITPMVFGYLASAELGPARHSGWFIVVLFGTILLECANCIHNELMDQEEDAINQPNRSTLVASVGEPTLWQIALSGYLICFIGLIPFAIFVSPLIATLLFLGGLAAPLYNWGPRLKRRPGLAQVAIAWAAFFSYIVGWAWNQPTLAWNHIFLNISPAIWLLIYFYFATCFIKDLPDVRGDERVGAPGIFSIRRHWVRKGLLLFVYLSPYLLTYTLVISGVLPPRFSSLFSLIPLGLVVMIVGERATTIDTMIVAYEFVFVYVHLFFLVLFLLDTPSGQAFLIAILLFAARTLSVYLQLAPRFVEPDFAWSYSISRLFKKSL